MIDFKKYGIESPQELMEFFEKNMKYGFVYRGKVFTEFEPDFQKNMDKLYKLRLGDDFIKNKYGVCWDFCELERAFFENANIQHKCYFIESTINKNEGGPTHTFALFKNKDKWFWFEYSWELERGIHEYKNPEAALVDIVKKFKSFYNNQVHDIKVYETKKFTKRVDTFDFVAKCTHSKQIDLQGKEL